MLLGGILRIADALDRTHSAKIARAEASARQGDHHGAGRNDRPMGRRASNVQHPSATCCKWRRNGLSSVFPVKNKPIQVGVVGCGWIMRSMYVPTLLSLPDAIRVTAVCDLNEEAARASAEKFESATVFTDVAALLQEAKLDAVMVLTSEKVNAAMAQRGLKAGLPVYLEKPPAVSSPQLEELIAAETRSKTFVYTRLQPEAYAALR